MWWWGSYDVILRAKTHFTLWAKLLIAVRFQIELTKDQILDCWVGLLRGQTCVVRSEGSDCLCAQHGLRHCWLSELSSYRRLLVRIVVWDTKNGRGWTVLPVFTENFQTISSWLLEREICIAWKMCSVMLSMSGDLPLVVIHFFNLLFLWSVLSWVSLCRNALS